MASRTGYPSTGWRKYDKSNKIPKKVTFRLLQLMSLWVKIDSENL